MSVGWFSQALGFAQGEWLEKHFPKGVNANKRGVRTNRTPDLIKEELQQMQLQF